MIHPAAAAAVACAAMAAAAWCNQKVIGWLPDDPPRPGRKQHQRPIPLAGVVLVPVFLPWLVAERAWWLVAGVCIAGAVGFADDRRKETSRDLDWRWKALGLGLAAGAAACGVALPWDDPLLWLGAGLFVFVVTNATNFLDNTDGVAASLAAVSLLATSRGNGAAAAVGFAALGFLPWNWPRPRLFLGDAGAYSLGLATGAFVAQGAVQQPSQLWTVAVQLGDCLQVVTARMALGLPPWIGDRRHLTHITQNLGLRREAVAPAFALLALGFAMLA